MVAINRTVLMGCVLVALTPAGALSLDPNSDKENNQEAGRQPALPTGNTTGNTISNKKREPTAKPVPLTPGHAQLVVSAVFDSMDCDLDGTIEPSEVDDHFAQLWHPADLDRSKALSRREYARTTQLADGVTVGQLFTDADRNGDALIGFSEYSAHLQRMILLADVNGDFEVSRNELGLTPHPKPERAFARRFGSKASGSAAGPKPEANAEQAPATAPSSEGP